MRRHIYVVCMLGYNEDYTANDYAEDLGEFTNVEMAKSLFSMLGEGDKFRECPHTEFRIEECEEDDYGVYCVDIIDGFFL